MSEAPNFKLFDVVKLGSYQFKPNHGDEHEPIEWIIIDKYDDGTALLMSKYGIEVQQYNEENVSTNWEDCSLRRWLNQEFLEGSFSEKEKEGMIPVHIHTPNKKGLFLGFIGKKTITTKDTIYILSAEEADGIFSNDSRRMTKPTPYAIKIQVAYIDEEFDKSCWWWLRSPGAKASMAGIVKAGTIYEDGEAVNFSGVTVRPVFKFNLNLLSEILSQNQ